MGNIYIGQSIPNNETLHKNTDVNYNVNKVSTQAKNDNKANSVDVSPVIRKEVEKLNELLATENTEAIISRHKVFGDTMVKIVNKTTNKVLLEIPPEKILDMIAKICEIAGIKIDKKV